MSVILVSNIPPNITKDKLQIYFQKSKNGGGDVRKIKFLEGGREAIVEFEENEDLSRLLQKEHSLLGIKIKVEEYKKLFLKVEATLSSTSVSMLGEYQIKLLSQHHKYIDYKLLKNGQILISTDSLDNLYEFEKGLKTLMQKSRRSSSGSDSSPVSHGIPVPVDRSISSRKQADEFNNQPEYQPPSSNEDFTGISWEQIPQPQSRTVSAQDPMLPEWSDGPLPQPQDGVMFWQNVEEGDYSVIKGKFCFPEGDFMIFSDSIMYPSYDCVVCLPSNPHGEVIKEMLTLAFEQRKLFYVRKNVVGSGFAIQSVYDIFGSCSTGEEINLSNKLIEIKQRLKELGILVPVSHSKRAKSHGEQSTSSYASVNNGEPMDISPSTSRMQSHPSKPRGPFPQPDNVKVNSEVHEKSLAGYPDCGAIHIYFRSPGGVIHIEDGQTIQYVSYNRTACLPANEEGRKLHAMLLEAYHQMKLFVVAWKAGIYLIRTKAPLLTSDNYPNEEYTQRLFQSLLKLEIPVPSKPPPLPKQSEAHYEEISDDESDKDGTEALRKGGPFPQPEKGVMRMESENENLKGCTASGTIKLYFRFAGGKMRIEGAKPSKSFEVQYSQMNIVAALPNNDNGRRLAIMLQTAFNDKKLFQIEKREGEPGFRVRPTVTLLTSDQYPKQGYFRLLHNDLEKLGIREPSSKDVSSLSIPKSTIRQGSSLPPEWATSHGMSATDLPGTATQPPQFAPMVANQGAGARRKINRSSTSSQRNMNSQTYSPSSIPNANDNKFDWDMSKKQNGKYSPQYRDVKSDRVSIGSKTEEEEKCAICLLPLSAQPTKKLSCNHDFHASCVDVAIKSNPKCPKCRQPVGNSSSQQQQQASFGAHNIPRSPTYQQTPNFGNFGPAPLSRSNTHPFWSQHSLYMPKPPTSTAFGNQPSNGRMDHHTEQLSLPGYEGYGTIVISYSFPSGIQQACHPSPGVQYDSTNRKAYLPDNSEGQDLLRMLKQAFNTGLTFTIGRSQSTGRDNQIVWNGIVHKTNRNGGRQSYGYPDPSYLKELRQNLNSRGIQ